MDFDTLLLKGTRAIGSISFVIMKADLLTEKEKKHQVRKASRDTTPTPDQCTVMRGPSRDIAEAVIPSSSQATEL